MRYQRNWEWIDHSLDLEPKPKIKFLTPWSDRPFWAFSPSTLGLWSVYFEAGPHLERNDQSYKLNVMICQLRQS